MQGSSDPMLAVFEIQNYATFSNLLGLSEHVQEAVRGSNTGNRINVLTVLCLEVTR